MSPVAGSDGLDGFQALAGFYVGEGTIADTLTRLADLARQTLAADMAGITMLVDGRPATAVFTDREAPEIDAGQYETGEGPCLDSWRHGRIEGITDTLEDCPWPAFAEAAAAHGVRSTLSLPLSAAGSTLGALNLYARTRANFDEVDRPQATAWSTAAAVVLANVSAYHDARMLGATLQAALRSRATIDQAIGIIMAGGGGAPDEAFQVLARASQRENRKLREIAEEIVAGAAARRPPPAAEG